MKRSRILEKRAVWVLQRTEGSKVFYLHPPSEIDRCDRPWIAHNESNQLAGAIEHSTKAAAKRYFTDHRGGWKRGEWHGVWVNKFSPVKVIIETRSSP